MESSNSRWTRQSILCKCIPYSLLGKNGCCRLVDGGEARGGLGREDTFGSSLETGLPEHCWSHNWSHREMLPPVIAQRWVAECLVVKLRCRDVVDPTLAEGNGSGKSRLPKGYRKPSDWLQMIARARSILKQRHSGPSTTRIQFNPHHLVPHSHLPMASRRLALNLSQGLRGRAGLNAVAPLRRGFATPVVKNGVKTESTTLSNGLTVSVGSCNGAAYADER
jgi:hypothetical protein